MWDRSRRPVRRLFACLCTAYTAIVGYVFWAGACGNGEWRMRTREDWANTVYFFTPLFLVMHAVSFVAYGRLTGAQQPIKKMTAHWFASHIVSMAHALVITIAALVNLYILWDAPARIKLGTRMPPVGSRWTAGYPFIAATGELFSAWLVYDLFLVLGVWAVLGSWETVAHHLGFLVAAGVLRGYSFAPWQATVCLCMEASTPFLNVCQLKEALGLEKRSPAVVGSFALFSINFFLFRIVLLGLGLLQLVVHWTEGPWAEPSPRATAPIAEPPVPAVPVLAAYGLLCLLCCALALMVMWFRRIIAILLPSAADGAQKLASDEPDGEQLRQPRSARELSDDEEIAILTV